MTFARMFKRVREDALQFTQTDLADALGCSRQHISRVERGLSEYCHSELLALSELSGVPVAAFFSVEELPPVACWMLDYQRLPARIRARADTVLAGVVGLAKGGNPPGVPTGVPTGVL